MHFVIVVFIEIECCFIAAIANVHANAVSGVMTLSLEDL